MLTPEDLAAYFRFDPFWAINGDAYDVLADRLGKLGPRARTMELGSGWSTLLMAAHTGERHIAIEQSPMFFATTLEALEDHGLGCTLHLAPLERGWYGIGGLRLEDGSIDLLLVDGPDHGGNRYHALPRLERYLSPSAIVLVDDARREAEIAMLERWSREFPQWEIRHLPAARGLAELKRKA